MTSHSQLLVLAESGCTPAALERFAPTKPPLCILTSQLANGTATGGGSVGSGSGSGTSRGSGAGGGGGGGSFTGGHWMAFNGKSGGSKGGFVRWLAGKSSVPATCHQVLLLKQHAVPKAA